MFCFIAYNCKKKDGKYKPKTTKKCLVFGIRTQG